jgi:hypothetical protein
MDINKALREISRVLKGGGDLWLTLHPGSMVFSRAKRAARSGDLKDIVLCSHVLLNGVLFKFFGIQISFLGRQETFQTVGGIMRAMKRAGLTCLPAQPSTHFIVHGQKPSPERGTEMMQDRRSIPRYPVQIPVEVRLGPQGHAQSETVIREQISDLSSFGCHVVTRKRLPLKTKVRLKISYTSENFEAHGTVIHARRNAGMGILFTRIEPNDQSVLDNWIADLRH